MAITFNQVSKTFHMYNKQISYIFRVMENGQLEQFHFGARIPERESYEYLHTNLSRNFAPCGDSCKQGFSLTHTKQEYPVYGSGDFREGAFTVAQENGSEISNFVYLSHEIYKGKKDILPLPATYVEREEEADSLAITLRDEVTETELILKYTIYNELSVVTRSAQFIQIGNKPVVLEKALSLAMDFSDKEYDMVYLSGAWARERYVKARKIEHGIQAIQSMRGTSSAEFNPFLVLKRPEATETSGNVYGFSLVYSGNFLGQVEVCTHDTTRVLMGIHPDTFSWELSQGESFQTPEVVMVFAQHGLNEMSQTYHKLYSNRLVRGQYRGQNRPVLLNNWEATYFDFNEEKIVGIAQKAQEVGVELFVLDDGWFGDRNDDLRGLGDWYVNYDKLENGINGLAKKVNDLGMDFGLWIEPEMVNPDSELYRKHPEWALATPNRYASLIRNQMVLDYSNAEVVEYIYQMLYNVIEKANIKYIKWDMNRYLTECYSSVTKPSEQKRVFHKYVLGVYDLYEKLTTAFPEILFESCSGGGARFDPGILFYAPQTWCSDCTDAMDRLQIQYGTSYVYPISTIGAHVSAVPNHQLGRTSSIATRANVAFFGAFGYELDLNQLTEEELLLVKEQIQFYKENRALLHTGVFHRILSPFEDIHTTAWIVVNESQTEGIAAYYQIINEVNARTVFFKLLGLQSAAQYKVEYFGNTNDMFCSERVFSGAELMEIGIPIDLRLFTEGIGDFASVIIKLQANQVEY